MMAKSDERDEERPVSGRLATALPFMVLAGLSGAAGVVGGLRGREWDWDTAIIFAAFLLLAGGGIWGLVRLKPWRANQPISPRTRKANNLFALSGLVSIVAFGALMVGTTDRDSPVELFYSPIPAAIAIAAIAAWLLSMFLSWLWYRSADEHERHAADFGNIVGMWLFTVGTPVWWVAARGGLLPEPNVMILWVAVMIVAGIGWFWRH